MGPDGTEKMKSAVLNHSLQWGSVAWSAGMYAVEHSPESVMHWVSLEDVQEYFFS